MKFLFDHNVSPYIARAIAILAERDGDHVEALTDKFNGASPADVEWLHRLGEEGGWAVISGDLRIYRNPHERRAWQRARVVVFFLERSWQKTRPQIRKAGRLMLRWPDIVEVAKRVDPPAAFKLPLTGKLQQF